MRWLVANLLILPALAFAHGDHGDHGKPSPKDKRAPNNEAALIEREIADIEREFQFDMISIDEKLFESSVRQEWPKYAKLVAETFAKKANDKNSKVHKVLRWRALKNMDEMNPSGGVEFPIKTEHVQMMGEVAEFADKTERCLPADDAENKTGKILCTAPGLTDTQLLVSVPVKTCHSGGCDKYQLPFLVEINFTPAKYEGSVQSSPKPRMVEPAGTLVRVKEFSKVDTALKRDF